MNSMQQDIDARTSLTSNNQFELLLFRLGGDDRGDHCELYGINVFKIREIVAMPPVTAIAGALPNMLGVVNLRGEILPVFDLPSIVGCKPRTGLNILLVTEFARTTQAFAVEAVEDIVRLEWSQVLAAETQAAGKCVTSIARLDGNVDHGRLAQVLDVETILRDMCSQEEPDLGPLALGEGIQIKPGAVILAADDSVIARKLIEQGLEAMGLPFIMTKTGKECWNRLQQIADEAHGAGQSVHDRVALVLSDLEMPEMDGFTLTRHIKQDQRFSTLPVVIHSSLSGTTNEEHVRNVGANAYVAKFNAPDLAAALRRALASVAPVAAHA